VSLRLSLEDIENMLERDLMKKSSLAVPLLLMVMSITSDRFTFRLD
jgi:hypothetical protein